MPARLTEEEATNRMSAFGWEPVEPYPGINTLWRCRCTECGDVSPVQLGTQKRSKGCQTCGRSNQVTEASAIAVMIDKGWRPIEPYPGLRTPWACVCIRCGSPSAASRSYMKTKSRQAKCLACWARKNGDSLRGRHAVDAYKRMTDSQLQPLEPYPGTGVLWLCLCLRCKKTVSTRHSTVQAGGMGCSNCKSIKGGATHKARVAVAAEAAVRAAGYSPLEPYPGMTVPWSCLCECGGTAGVWATAIDRGRRGCDSCNPRGGFKSDRPGIVYLLVNEALGAIKVGVTAPGSYRIVTFSNHGWKAVHTETFDTGADALAVEKEILGWWRKDLGLPAYLSAEDMPIGGATETAELEAMPAHVAMERVREAAAQVRGLTLAA